MAEVAAEPQEVVLVVEVETPAAGVSAADDEAEEKAAPLPEEAPASTPLMEEVGEAEEPAVEAPALEAPALEALALEAPALEAPALEEPAVEAPALEAPAVEVVAVEEAQQLKSQLKLRLLWRSLQNQPWRRQRRLRWPRSYPRKKPSS